MEKELIYRINFEGAESELAKLTQIQQRLEEVRDEKTRINANDKNALERNKLEQQELAKLYRQQQGYIKDQNNALKGTADSLGQMRAQARQYAKELEKIPVGTKEFEKMRVTLNNLNTKIRNIDKSTGNFKTNIGNYASSFGEAFSTLGIGVSKATAGIGAMSTATGPLGMAIVALGGGVKVFNGALRATDTLADKYDVFMSQASEVTKTFFKSIATGDWGNLLGNMREAVRIGREYAETMDQITDRSNELQIAEAKADIQIQAQQKILKDQMRTNDERIAAGRKIIEIENKLALRRKQLSQDELNAEVKRIAQRNKLSQQEVMNFVEYYSKYEKQIEKLNELDKKRNELAGLQTSQQSWDGRSSITTTNPAAVSQLQAEIEVLETETKNYSTAIRNFANVTGDEREILKERLKKYYTEWASFDKNTQRVASRLSALLEENMREGVKNVQKAVKEIEVEFQQFPQNWNYVDEIKMLPRKYTDTSASIKGTTYAYEGSPTTGDPDRLEGKLSAEETIQSAGQFVAIWSDAYNAREQALRESLEKGLITEKQYQKESEKIAKRQNAIQRTLVIAQLAADMARTLSALGVGSANTAKIGFPQNIPMLIAFAAQAAGIIANLKSIKFEKGGIIGGNLHSQGGTKFIGSDGSRFEAERGELLTIVNRYDTARIKALSDINSVHGRPFYNSARLNYFAEGGIYTPNNMTSGSEDMVRSLVKQIGSIPVVLNTRQLHHVQQTSRKIDLIGNI